MAEYGWHPTNPSLHGQTSGVAGSINQRASHYGPMTEYGHVYAVGARVGRIDDIPNVSLDVWEAVGPTTYTPDDKVGFSAEFTAGTYMVDATDGTWYERNLVNSFIAKINYAYFIGWVTNESDELGYGYRTRSDAYPNLNKIFNRNVPGDITTGQDPFGETSSSTGQLAAYMVYEPNVAPTIPNRDIADPPHETVVNTTTPTFQAYFSDANETLPNGLTSDWLQAYQIIVYDAANVIVWDSGSILASEAEQLASRFTKVYGGSTSLIEGEEYNWICRVQDRCNAWSSWMTNSYFTVAIGYVDVSAGTPTGKQETLTPGPFTGSWEGATTIDEVKIRLVHQPDNLVLETSPWIDIANVGDEGAISVSFAQTTWANLDPGGQYGYQFMARDASDNESGWSEVRTFYVDAAPTVPALLSPLAGSASSTAPLFTFRMSDTDDTTASGLVGYVRLKDDAGVVIGSAHAATYNAVDDQWEWQSVDADFTGGEGTYFWDAYGYDGTLYSGGSTTLVASSTAEDRQFDYVDGPAITIDSPTEAEEVNTTTPWYNWTIAGTQTKYRVEVYDGTSGLEEPFLIYDTGEVVSASESYRQKAGYLDEFDEAYLVVHAWDNLNIEGISEPRYFTINTEVADEIVGFTASGYAARHDVQDTAIRLSWTQTNYPSGDFEGYYLYRKADPDTIFDADDEVEDRNQRIAEITSPTETTFVDFLPASGVSYTYGIRQIVRIDGEAVSSPMARVQASVTFAQTVICNARHGGARRAVFQYRGDRTINREREQSERVPWNKKKPTIFRTNRFNRRLGLDLAMGADETVADMQEMMMELDRMDSLGGPLCYRDGRGRKYFGEIVGFEEIDTSGGRPREITLEFLQTSATEEFDT
jgi:hypothetical protein